MAILETKAGFPDIGGYVMHNHIECNYSGSDSVMLWFHSHTPDLTSIMNIHVYLLGASMKGANVELNPLFPFVKSYSIKQEFVQDRLRKLLNIFFEKGEISFLFEDVFHVRSLHHMGPVPDEVRKRLTQK